MDGPTDLTLENQNSNHARNAMFEIAIAGRLAKRGLVPRLGGEPDVLSKLEDRNILAHFSENDRYSEEVIAVTSNSSVNLPAGCD